METKTPLGGRLQTEDLNTLLKEDNTYALKYRMH